ncbi:glycosyltransferase [Acidianus sp. HS-5]|uniref:glycosyltransferase family 2 protein n=1 Tax=Acidianus sp. HS-5 TaxID=2886040 RepID=UPI001F357B0E|nr:glycosyltransferase [Acidianus sp. HS-5]BDC17394.1 glycosyl transferase [Acidianus sp. HS-5]
MLKDPLVSVIIPSINPQKSLNLLNSLTTSTYDNLEVIIIFDYVKNIPDINDSIKSKFKYFNMIINDKPLLKSCSVNKGIRIAKGKYILVIDEDNIVLEDSIQNLLLFMESHPEVGCAQPIVYTIDGFLQHYGGFWNSRFGTIERPNLYNSKDFVYVDLVTDCILIRKTLIDKIGFFSPEIPWGDNDADFALRTKKEGYKCAVVLTSKVLHDKKIDRINYKNAYDILHSKVIIQKKHFNKNYSFYIFLVVLVTYYGIYIPLKQREFKNILKYLKASISGVIDGFKGKYNIKLIRDDYIYK